MATINVILEFSPLRVMVGSQSFDDSFIVTPDTVISPWLRKNRGTLSNSDLFPLLALDVDILLVGTGPTQEIPGPSVYRAFVDKGMSIEFMDSAAACRTYNILVGEQRRVGAGITLPIG
ncbi:MAG: MTH938/NDUFAF3 family protein [Pseudomonadota bacterium]|nr:MTH938/NDUFAF3 family protein [Pseudomonadota bacterium]MEC8888705.1 MTH938/NDUFAF3 family protein [Pseudomonadota bacterium]MEC9371213.1 MTH938/NDUFAF3 family protein [Pseudomonadota bacterium]MEE3292173.1 MTH938/NDUFAF3 family protein [Pseudomonadota bacterium]